MTAPKYRVVHQFTHHWICDVIREVTPAEFQVDFWDRTEPGATQSLLPQADFVVCLSLDAEEAQLLDRCRLVMHNGVGYDAIADPCAEVARHPVGADSCNDTGGGF